MGKLEEKGSLTSLAIEATARNVVWPKLPIVIAELQTGEIIYASEPACDVFGYECGELVGEQIETLVPIPQRAAHVNWRKDVGVPKTRLMGMGRQVWGRKKDGTVFPAHVGLTSMDFEGRQVGVAYVIDLTGQLLTGPAGVVAQAEAQVAEQLGEVVAPPEGKP